MRILNFFKNFRKKPEDKQTLVHYKKDDKKFKKEPEKTSLSAFNKNLTLWQKENYPDTIMLIEVNKKPDIISFTPELAHLLYGFDEKTLFPLKMIGNIPNYNYIKDPNQITDIQEKLKAGLKNLAALSFSHGYGINFIIENLLEKPNLITPKQAIFLKETIAYNKNIKKIEIPEDVAEQPNSIFKNTTYVHKIGFTDDEYQHYKTFAAQAQTVLNNASIVDFIHDFSFSIYLKPLPRIIQINFPESIRQYEKNIKKAIFQEVLKSGYHSYTEYTLEEAFILGIYGCVYSFAETKSPDIYYYVYHDDEKILPKNLLDAYQLAFIYLVSFAPIVFKQKIGHLSGNLFNGKLLIDRNALIIKTQETQKTLICYQDGVDYKEPDYSFN